MLSSILVPESCFCNFRMAFILTIIAIIFWQLEIYHRKERLWKEDRSDVKRRNHSEFSYCLHWIKYAKAHIFKFLSLILVFFSTLIAIGFINL